MTSPPLSSYVEPGQIRDRLAVLYAKADGIVLYNYSCSRGVPDVRLLDEKQQAILAKYGRSVGQPFPKVVRRTLGRTIDVLVSRLRLLERAAA